MIFPIAAITVVLVFYASFGVAAPGVGPPGTSFENITYAGSGCPAGTVQAHPSPDWANFTLTFDKFTPQAGPGVLITERRKSCHVNAKIRVPLGYQYTPYQLEWSGRLVLDKKVRYTFQADHGFAALTNQKATFAFTVTGPFADSFDFIHTLPDAALIWSPCGGAGDGSLNINMQVYLDSSQNPAATFPAPEFPSVFPESINTRYHLQWRKC